MLVTFKTAAHGNITMFGSVATDLLKMMGQSGNVPGALMAEDVDSALQHLNTGLSRQPVEADNPPAAADDDENAPPPVALSVRAKPLIDLLEAAVSAGKPVLWESD